MFSVIIDKKAQKEILQIIKSGDKKSIKRLNQILLELELHPKEGIGNPEMLKHDLTGLWSRRINKKDRLIYEVKDEIVTVYVVSAMGHYED
jgi:toxin YoeB|uniref:Txe/YoeB family addiction module toxin n=1 Tax=Flavobacterium sp. TaxID=239 RepID=UPI00404B0210